MITPRKQRLMEEHIKAADALIAWIHEHAEIRADIKDIRGGYRPLHDAYQAAKKASKGINS